jgi:hypothetical protein
MVRAMKEDQWLSLFLFLFIWGFVLVQGIRWALMAWHDKHKM